VSWRIQVALRSTFLNEVELQLFIEGTKDGKKEQDKVDDIIRGILRKKVEACQKAFKLTEGKDFSSLLARKLWTAELTIAQISLEQLED
jgi:hypothetical protein